MNNKMIKGAFVSVLLAIGLISCSSKEKTASTVRAYEISDGPLYSVLDHYAKIYNNFKKLSRGKNFIVVQFDSLYQDSFYIQVFKIDSSMVGMLLKSDKGTIFGLSKYNGIDVLLFGDEKHYSNNRTKKKVHVDAIDLAQQRLLESKNHSGLIRLNFECDIYFFAMSENGYRFKKVIFDAPHL